MAAPNFYRPTILGSPSLAILAVVACVLLGLTEYATRALEPMAYKQSATSDLAKFKPTNVNAKIFDVTRDFPVYALLWAVLPRLRAPC